MPLLPCQGHFPEEPAVLQQIGRGEHSEQCLPTLILVLGKKETLLGISLQRVTGQTESEFFRGSRVVPMGETGESALHCGGSHRTGQTEFLLFFSRNPKSQKGGQSGDGFFR